MYIGQTKRTLKERIKDHIKEIKRSNLPFHRAIKKYGIDNFVLETYEFNIEELNEQEKLFIIKYDSINNGYNLKPGGCGNYEHNPSEEARFKMGWNRGLKLSEEHKEKISQSHIGKTHTEESKLKMSKNGGSRKGKKQSKEQIEKKIISLRKVKHFNVRIVKFTNPEGIEYIETHSVNQFCERHNLCRRNITDVLSGKIKKHKGWFAEYLE